MEARIRSLVEPIARELGVEVLQVNLGSGGHSQMLRVVIDKRGGVDSDTLERISRGLSLQLDAEDLIAGQYRLEISSPGLSWPLTTAADFARYEGEWVKVMFPDGDSLEGTNLGPVEGGFRLQDADGEHTFAMAEVAKVTRAINWKAVSGKKKK
ncbi:MAG TPA: ribosome maturation factor RimP [Mariprofundaceae bacterium]|nr:ribosome maturation factor RimP [Mariprofundaceae bacterium]